MNIFITNNYRINEYNRKRQLQNKKMLLFGTLLWLIVYLPILVNNSGMLSIIHDEYDGELLSYILQVKHIHETCIPELFNGTPKESLTVPAPAFLIFYYLFEPSEAFFYSYILIGYISFLGMFIFVNKLVNVPFISLFTAILFSMLPFYSVYGLSVMGQSILFYSFFSLCEKNSFRRKALYYCLIALFSLSSSFALVGVIDLLLLLVLIVVAICTNKQVLALIIGWSELLLIYLVTNLNLLAPYFNKSSSFVSHRTEFISSSTPFFQSYKTMLTEGMYHAASCHLIILYCSVVITIGIALLYDRFTPLLKKRAIEFLLLEGFIVLIAVFYASWHCHYIVALRNQLGGFFVTYQIDRVYWLYPCLWFIVFAYDLYFVFSLCKNRKIALISIVLLTLLNARHIWANSTIQVNLKSLVGKEYTKSSYTSIHNFYQPDLFQQIDDYIGLPKSQYRVVSLGLYPSIPLYNGFYCIDGYSNNYSVDYKHRFRVIIKNELEKEPELKKYFDEWGNRVYLFNHELKRSYYINKNSTKELQQFDYDYTQLKNMGCKYVFSSVPIKDTSFLHYEKKFESSDSYYKVILYSLY